MYKDEPGIWDKINEVERRDKKESEPEKLQAGSGQQG
jgi:hypothetical protein